MKTVTEGEAKEIGEVLANLNKRFPQLVWKYAFNSFDHGFHGERLGAKIRVARTLPAREEGKVASSIGPEFHRVPWLASITVSLYSEGSLPATTASVTVNGVESFDISEAVLSSFQKAAAEIAQLRCNLRDCEE